MKNKIQHIKEFIKKHKTLFLVLTILKLILKIGVVLYFVCKADDVAAQSTNKILRQGNSAYNNQKYNNATESYSKALQKEPKDVRAHFNQGDALFQLNELDKAKESYTTASKLSKNTDVQAKCSYNIGNAFYKQEKWEESAKAYKTSLKLNPKDADAKYNLMMALSKIKKDAQSNKDNKKDKKDDKKDQKKDDKQDQNKQNKPDDKQGQDKKDEQQQGQQPKEQQGEMTKEQAEKLLEAMQAEEGKVQQKLAKEKGKPVKGKVQKDW